MINLIFFDFVLFFMNIILTIVWYGRFSLFGSHYGAIFSFFSFFKLSQELKATIKCDNGKTMTRCFHSAMVNQLHHVAIHYTHNGTPMTICFHFWRYYSSSFLYTYIFHNSQEFNLSHLSTKFCSSKPTIFKSQFYHTLEKSFQ